METPAESLNHVLQQVPVTQVATPIRASAAVPYYDEQQASNTVTVNDEPSFDSMTAQGPASTSVLNNVGRILGPNQLLDKNKKKDYDNIDAISESNLEVLFEDEYFDGDEIQKKLTKIINKFLESRKLLSEK